MKNIKKIVKNGLIITSFTLLSGGLIHQFEKNDLVLEEKAIQEVKAKSNMDQELQQKYIEVLEEKEVVEDEEVEEVEEVIEDEEVEEVIEDEEVEEVEDLFDEVYYNSIIEELTRVKKQVKDLEGYIEDLEQLRLQEEAKIIK